VVVRLRRRLAQVVVGIGACGVLVGVPLFFTSRSIVSVNVRQGAPALPPGQNALVVLQAQMVERLIRQSVSEADLPFQASNVQAKFGETGILVSGKAESDLFGVPLTVGFSALAHPVMEDGGKVGVRLTDVRAEEGSLPTVFVPALEGVINKKLTEVAHLDEYRVRDVEMAKDSLLVYLQWAPPGAG
jgi:hypothetical protein